MDGNHGVTDRQIGLCLLLISRWPYNYPVAKFGIISFEADIYIYGNHSTSKELISLSFYCFIHKPIICTSDFLTTIYFQISLLLFRPA
jgi:hypothetical protein